jgi:UDP-galactopyranose mutase
MNRFAKTKRVFFLEEPVFEEVEPHLRLQLCPRTNVHVATPVLRSGMRPDEIIAAQRQLLSSMIRNNNIRNYIAWYYTPMAREFASWLKPAVTVYDCMDELSCFAGAPAAMKANEVALFQEADLVFTGGASLYASKRKQHSSVHLFPSSVDFAHFSQALGNNREPDDQVAIPKPRLGYAGVIDERLDLELVREIAAARPEWHFVFLGPVVKIDPASLPRAANVHYLGIKPYDDLPAYFSGWQIGMLPFVLNDATRFISPTKTPEYLAAGLKVISTPIQDVVTPYGDLDLVGIAADARKFLRIADSYLDSPPNSEFRSRVESFLAQNSWDATWSKMNELITKTLITKDTSQIAASSREGVAHV